MTRRIVAVLAGAAVALPCALLAAAPAQASGAPPQFSTFDGYVVDARTGTPVANADVDGVDDLGFPYGSVPVHATTDASGYYRFSAPGVAPTTFHASAAGYQDSEPHTARGAYPNVVHTNLSVTRS
jgi:Carboxypeptidase regulatory-like domain